MLSNYELLKQKYGLACIANNTLQVSLLDDINSGMHEVNLFKSPQQFRYRFYYYQKIKLMLDYPNDTLLKICIARIQAIGNIHKNIAYHFQRAITHSHIENKPIHAHIDKNTYI